MDFRTQLLYNDIYVRTFFGRVLDYERKENFFIMRTEGSDSEDGDRADPPEQYLEWQ